MWIGIAINILYERCSVKFVKKKCNTFYTVLVVNVTKLKVRYGCKRKMKFVKRVCTKIVIHFNKVL